MKKITVPKVLFVIPGTEHGSSMVFARRQAENLTRSREADVECFHLQSRTSIPALLREAKRFRAVVARYRPDVVHAHFGTVTAMFAVLFSGGCPVVITYRGSDLNLVPRLNGLRARVGRVLSQLAALGATKIVCVSDGLRRQLWWCQSRVTVLPSGVDTEVFQPAAQQEARIQLGWPLHGRVVLFNAGHDALNKRLDLAEATMAELGRQMPAARMEVLRGEALPDRIPLLMNGADCLLVTSDAEGSPTVVQEAMAVNLPVVSVAVGDVPERLSGVIPSLISQRDPKTLAASLAAILESPQRSNGRTKVNEFSSRHIASELARLYRSLVHQKSQSPNFPWNITLFSQR